MKIVKRVEDCSVGNAVFATELDRNRNPKIGEKLLTPVMPQLELELECQPAVWQRHETWIWEFGLAEILDEQGELADSFYANSLPPPLVAVVRVWKRIE